MVSKAVNPQPLQISEVLCKVLCLTAPARWLQRDLSVGSPKGQRVPSQIEKRWPLMESHQDKRPWHLNYKWFIRQKQRPSSCPLPSDFIQAQENKNSFVSIYSDSYEPVQWGKHLPLIPITSGILGHWQLPKCAVPPGLRGSMDSEKLLGSRK